MLSIPKPRTLAEDMAWFKTRGLKLEAPTLPLVLRDKARKWRIFKSVAFGVCDWLVLDLAARMRGVPFTKTNDKVDEW